MPVFYHRVPTALRGERLYPLNQLRDIYPDLYAAEVEKYSTRRYLLDERVPGLGCLWNDVLHLSPVSPADIRDAFLGAGLLWRSTDWFVIDPAQNPAQLDFTEENTIIYTHATQCRHLSDAVADFKPYTLSAAAEFSTLPPAAIAYYRRGDHGPKGPLVFSDVPHILHCGSLPIKDLSRIRI